MGGGGARRTSVEFTDGHQPAGIYGWRKQCLYATILFILIVAIMNLSLTIWILRVLDFSIDGLHLGQVRLTSSGIQVLGQAELLNTLYTSKIMSKHNQNIDIESSRDIYLRARNKDQEITSRISIGSNEIEATCNRFEVKDSSGKSRFLVTEKEVQFGIDEVHFNGKVVFNGSVVSPLIRSPHMEPLRIESNSREILSSAQKDVSIEAPFGDVEVKSSNIINFSADQKIIFNSTRLFIPSMKISSPNGSGKKYNDVYQLCMCKNGRIFLSASDGTCLTSRATCS